LRDSCFLVATLVYHVFFPMNMWTPTF